MIGGQVDDARHLGVEVSPVIVDARVAPASGLLLRMFGKGGRRRQIRRGSRQRGSVKLGQVRQDDAKGPTIRDDVIDIKHQHMPPRRQPGKTRADRQVGGDVKGLARILGDHPVEGGLRVVLTAQVDLGQGVGLRRAHLKMRAAAGKAQPQRIVPRDHRIPCRL